jgi:hypothetical protein
MITRIAWLLLAVLHVLPAVAVIRPSLLTSLYGVDAGSDLALLLQHRAALFAAVVAVAMLAAFRREARQAAALVVGLSMVSFLILYALGGAPSRLTTIAIADLIGLPVLGWVAWQAWRRPA